jgi:hypothetical protein
VKYSPALLLLTLSLALLGLAPSAQAATTICSAGEKVGQCESPQGLATDFETGRLYVADKRNNRVDVFEANGAFAFAFGWGVADGVAEPQTCGPAATPPTANCRAGLAGGGAGEFDSVSPNNGLADIAVDNDPASPSHHDVYVLERDETPYENEVGHSPEGRGYRVQKFDPEGSFLLTFGGGVIAGAVAGTGNLSVGSSEITAVNTTKGVFEVGQAIESSGKIAASTTILGIGPGTITLSKPAIGSGAAAPISVAAGAGNVAQNEVLKLVNRISGGESGPPNFIFSTPDPSPSKVEIGPSIPPDANAAEMQAALEALPNVGAGNVKVTGENVSAEVHEYTVEFSGRFADTNVIMLPGPGVGNREVITVQNGGGAAELCTAADASSCSAGVQGSGHGQFDRNPVLAVGPAGQVYVADCVSPPDSNCKDRLQKFNPSGAFTEELPLPQSQFSFGGLAVEQSGDFYVSIGAEGEIRKYDSAANLIGPLPGAQEPGSLALDPSGRLFAVESDAGNRVIAVYDPAGNTLRRFGYGEVSLSGISGIAARLAGDGLYTSEGPDVLLRPFPPPGPIVAPQPCKTSSLGNTKATLQAEVNPEGRETTVYFQYVDRKHFQEEGGFASKETKVTEDEALGADFKLHKAFGEAELAPETEYICRVIATNSDVPAGVEGEEGPFTSLKPLEFGPTTVSGVGAEEATLNAQVNPLGIETTGYFEYVEEATYLKDIEELGPEHGFDHAVKTPDPATEEIDFGNGKGLKVGSATVKGLQPGTAYRFRLHATNAFFKDKGEDGVLGPTAFLRTHGAASEPLPDERGWELVSPAEKNSAEVVGTANGRGFIGANSVQIQAGATDGEAITYTSWVSFADAQAAPPTSQYLSTRTPSGWQTDNISPFGFQSNLEVPPYLGFTPDLRFGAVKAAEAPLAPGCPADAENLYFHEAGAGALRCLTPEAPNTANKFGYCFTYGGASEDGSRVFFKSQAPYAGAPAGTDPSLYEFHEGQIHVVSVLPGQSEPVAPGSNTSFGMRSAESCQSGQTVLHHAISADGTRVIWTYWPDTTKPSELLMRIDGTETIQLDAPHGGTDKTGGNGTFWAASKDGSVVYFTDAARLTKGSKAEAGAEDLYRYELEMEELTDLTKPKASEPADVQGVLGASDDGSYVYFVAKSALTPEAEKNQADQHAEAGENNLYRYDAAQAKATFIAQLSGEDSLDWERQPQSITARVSPDGRHLAFLSVESQSLAGYDNTLGPTSGTFSAGTHCRIDEAGTLGGSEACPEAFLYDAEAGTLTCASCNPTGARPTGPALLPGWTSMSEGPRYLSEDGQRLFFETYDTLSTQDENDLRDVYEFELPGSGGCTNQSPAYDPASGGCHYLLSGGKSTDDAHLIDASSDGRDVFFSTRSALNGWDTNENYDVYDAREGGGFPEPQKEPICEAEASCTPPATQAPLAPSAATATLVGAGNPKPKPKHKHAKKKHKKHAKKHKATKNRRAGR